MQELTGQGPASFACTPTSAAPAKIIEQLYKSVKFVELFAGAVVLTRAVETAGVPVAPPNEVELGYDFRCPKDVEALKEWLREISAGNIVDEMGAVKQLFIHLAPPCSTFSKARDRNSRTRVRTWAQPGGIKPRSKKVKHGNRIAKACILFAKNGHGKSWALLW